MNGRKGQMKKLDLIIGIVLVVFAFFGAGFKIGRNYEQSKLESQGYFPIEILQRTNAYYSSEIEKIREACFEEVQRLK